MAAFGAALFGLLPSGVSAQSFDVTGTRAAGMGGAFVGVADDASALYWNPAGLASGSYFSLALDASGKPATPETGPRGGSQSSFFLGLTTPALGLTYYRLQQITAKPSALLVPTGEGTSDRNLQGTEEVRRSALTTHHAGVTLVQSLFPAVAVGATLKLVSGHASSQVTNAATAREAIDQEASGENGSTHFDADLGVMANSPRLKAGLTMRNLMEPEFTSNDGVVLALERQLRAGASWSVKSGWILASDLDLLVTHDAFGSRRDFAVGVEGRLIPRIIVRSGFKMNLADAEADIPDAAARGYSAGASVAVTAAVLVDAFGSAGGDRAGHGWGISARFVY
jgi:hypothetical protein